MDLFKVKKSSKGGGGELSEVPTTGGCPLLGVPTYYNVGHRGSCDLVNITNNDCC